MSVKIKVFPMRPENSEEITKFLETIKVVNNGILISENNLGIMYKETSDVGLDKDEAINALSAELAKSQKQYIISKNVTKSYLALIDKYSLRNATLDNEIKDIEGNLANLYDPTLENKVIDLNEKLAEAKSSHKKATTPEEKEEYLISYKKINDELNETVEEFNKYKSNYENEVAEMNKQVGPLKVEFANNLGEIKFLNGCLYDTDTQNGAPAGTVKATEDAMVFIKNTIETIKKLEAEGLQYN